MAKNTANQQQDPEQMIEERLSRFETFLEQQGKTMLVALGAIVILVGAFFGYKYLHIAPQKEKAASAMYEAQLQFERDSLSLALNGDASFDGFLTIADKYKNTPQGNLANHYAGICLLHTGDFEGAIQYFNAFKPISKGSVGIIMTAKNYGMTGDAYVELGKLQEGANMYEKAAAYSDNADSAPTYLKKAGMLNEELGNTQKALEQYKTIKTKYARSFPARDIDKFIAKVEQGL